MAKKEIKWRTSNTIYEELPLYLRLPDYDNIWRFKDKYSNLFCITYNFEKVKSNGLPVSDYNLSLMDFDIDLANLFDIDEEGIIILIETYGGSRNYWYYISSKTDYKAKVDSITKKYPSNIVETDLRADLNWGFIKQYPVELYVPK